MSVEMVRELLQKFQVGYSQRDPAHLDEFMKLFIPGGDLCVVGTAALKPGDVEWCQGQDQVRELISNDWQHWGDVIFDVAGAQINVRGDTTWLVTTGTVTDLIPYDERYKGFLEYTQGVLDEESVEDKQKMTRIVQLGVDMVFGMLMPERCVWPFRLTAVAVKEANGWQFAQMQFAFATLRPPDERYE